METKLNIIEILKNKPKGTKLYSPLFGDVYLSCIKGDVIEVEHHGRITKFFKGRYYNYPKSKPLLFPSKKMQNWFKFAWNPGDILVNKDGNVHIIFEGFDDDTYETFNGNNYLWENEGITMCFGDYEDDLQTLEFYKANKEDAQKYIYKIEGRLVGKFNLETLEIEKPAFKDGDILCVIDNSNDYHYILIYEGQDDKHIHRYVTMFEDNSLNIKKDSYLTKPEDYSTHYATDEEKQQLFDALAKEGKAWDSKKKMIVDLKLKHKFKPFDKIIVLERFAAQEWVCDVFSHYSKDYVGKEIIIGLGGCTYYKALPFNEETAKLLGTTKDVEG